MANNKSKELIAWISLGAIMLVLITSLLGIEASNERILDTIVYCLTGIVISYFTGASYETVRGYKYGKKDS